MDERGIYGGRIRFRKPVEEAVHDADSLAAESFSFDFMLGVNWNYPNGTRLLGCDTPEIHPITNGRTAKSLDWEKRAGQAARQRVIELIKGAHAVYLETQKETDKFGRLLSKMWLVSEKGEWTDVAALLITEGHAHGYFGDKKIAFESWYKGPVKPY